MVIQEMWFEHCHFRETINRCLIQIFSDSHESSYRVNLQDHSPTLQGLSQCLVYLLCLPSIVLIFSSLRFLGLVFLGRRRKAASKVVVVVVVFPTIKVQWEIINMHRTNLSCSWYLSRTSSNTIRFGPSPPTKKCNSGYFWQSSGIIPLSKSIPKRTEFRTSCYCIWC